jgi:hypothetical protein
VTETPAKLIFGIGVLVAATWASLALYCRSLGIVAF